MAHTDSSLGTEALPAAANSAERATLIGAPVQSSNWTLWLIASPLLMTASYGAMRVLMAMLTQWRDGIFARVAMHAVRKLAYITFVHMHELSLRFHLERKTGGLTRVLERGRSGIEVIVRMVILQLIPTVVEVTLIMGVLLWKFDWRYVLATMITVVIFMYYTYLATEWRIEIRRKMNDSDTEANTKAIDSLLNYETVKYFGAEEREAARYDRSMERYERASVKTYTSLALLNTGQAVIFTAGLTATMLMCAIGVRNGPNTVGDFVMVNAMMIQLYQPLNFMGMVDPERLILKGLSFEVPAGKTVAIVGPSGAGKSTSSRLLFRLYDVSSGKILIDGQNIRNVTQSSLRASIGMVPQDTVLFNDTIRYNIRYGRWDASDAEVEQAAQLAQIDDFIRMSPTRSSCWIRAALPSVEPIPSFWQPADSMPVCGTGSVKPRRRGRDWRGSPTRTKRRTAPHRWSTTRWRLQPRRNDRSVIPFPRRER